jgi:hypothetical protein
MHIVHSQAQTYCKVEAVLQQQEAKAVKRSMWAQLTSSSSSSPAANDGKKFRFNFSAQPPQ